MLTEAVIGRSHRRSEGCACIFLQSQIANGDTGLNADWRRGPASELPSMVLSKVVIHLSTVRHPTRSEPEQTRYVHVHLQTWRRANVTLKFSRERRRNKDGDFEDAMDDDCSAPMTKSAMTTSSGHQEDVAVISKNDFQGPTFILV
jgi:hypothetical protein